ncbi:MAG: deoxyribose-phosphate aldolase [Treponema sp.]|jgi:deoxyribose-phosphate aldolase|nr:deoxyribose-phosphate aldolase [Treponema sp.]
MSVVDKELIERIAREVLEEIAKSGVGPSRFASGGGSGPALAPSDLAKYIDHTLLKAEAKPVDIDKLCGEAKQYHFFSVCVNSSSVSRCAGNLQGSGVKVCSVVGFPLGAMCTRAKAFEASAAIEDGAREIDMVMNIGAMKAGDLKTVEDDMAAIRKACSGGVLLKVIIETCLLSTEEIIKSCEIAKNAGLDFVKTSTGFSTAGATPEHVALMRKTVGPVMGVKAAGGVRSFQDAVNMINAGATRLGTSGGVNILKGQTIKGY